MKMKALVYQSEAGWDNSRGLEKIECTTPQLDESKNPEDALSAIVKLSYAGFCGSDRGIWYRSAFKDLIQDSLQLEQKKDRITGHELVGEIVELGSLAKKNFALHEGQFVAAESHIVCGTCYQCQTGQGHVCQNEQILGISVDGCFAEYVKLPGKIIWKTNTDLIDMRVASIQEPFGNAVHLCTQGDLRGKTVLILGCGTIGLFSTLIAREWGAARIIGVDPNPRQQQMALACGADEVFAPPPSGDQKAEDNFIQTLKSSTPHRGADVVMEVAGFNSSVNVALSVVRRGGLVLLFGLKGGTFHIPDFEKIILNGIELKSVVGRQIFQTWHHTRSLLENHKNGIQDKVLNIILNKGEGTVYPFKSFEKEKFETQMNQFPKITLSF